MKNSHFRRPGCDTCKVKRIKCDKTIPSCQRCLKAGRTCPGYQGLDVVFRDMGKYAKEKVQSRVRDRLKHDPDASANSSLMIEGSEHSRIIHASSVDQSGLVDALRSNIPPQVDINWEDVAIPRFFADWLDKPSESVDPSNYSVIGDIISENGSCVGLNEALRAVALSNLANQIQQHSLAIEAKKSFNRAISSLANLLQDAKEVKKDSTLVTCLLFGFFNIIRGWNISRGWVSFHLHGRVALLSLRDEEQLKTQTSQKLHEIISMIHCHLMGKCATLHIPPPEKAVIWIEAARPDSRMHSLSLLVIQQVRLGVQAQALFDEKNQNEWWVIGLLKVVKEAIQIDNDYQDWDDSASGIWAYKKIRFSSTLNHAPQHIYEGIKMCIVWNRNRSLRIHLHEILLHCCRLIQSHPFVETLSFDFEGTRRQSAEIISQMINDICASTPYCLGLIDSEGRVVRNARPTPKAGFFLVFPLYIAMVSAEDGSETERWFREQLEYISDALGIRIAGLLAQREKKDPWDVR